MAITLSLALNMRRMLKSNNLAIPVDELDLGYRHSRIADEGMVVLSTTFNLDRG